MNIKNWLPGSQKVPALKEGLSFPPDSKRWERHAIPVDVTFYIADLGEYSYIEYNADPMHRMWKALSASVMDLACRLLINHTAHTIDQTQPFVVKPFPLMRTLNPLSTRLDAPSWKLLQFRPIYIVFYLNCENPRGSYWRIGHQNGPQDFIASGIDPYSDIQDILEKSIFYPRLKTWQ